MSAPQPPADGHAPGDDATAATPGTTGREDGTGTYDFHGEKLDFDPYRFGAPEPTTPAWDPAAPTAPGPGDGGRPPAPGERWTPGPGAGAPPVQPGDFWGGAGSHRGTFPPAGYVPPPAAPGDDADRPRVDLGKPGDPSAPPSSAPGGWNPPTGTSPSPYGAPTPPPYPYSAAPGQYPAPLGMPAPGAPGRNGLAIAGLVVGIVGVLLAITSWPGILVGLVGVGLAIPGLVKARRGASGKGIAIAGLIVSVVAVVLSTIALVVVLNRIDFDCIVRANGDTSQAQECIR